MSVFHLLASDVRRTLSLIRTNLKDVLSGPDKAEVEPLLVVHIMLSDL